MNPAKVDRSRLTRLEDLPNIGPAMARDLRLLGIQRPADLAGRDPVELYQALCHATGRRQDPCVLDVFMSVTRFMAGGPALPWWGFTAERKRLWRALGLV
ncbi:MAG: helix-hairpin-helix domain-containing protein [Pseudomonadota bacterium]